MGDPFPRPALRWSTVSALYAILTVAYCWPLLLSFASALPNDTGDPGFISFLLWANAQSVPFTEKWWNTPMYYPQTGVLAFSDTLLGMAPFSNPLIWAGVSAVATFNTLFVASVFTAALSAHALARHLTGRHEVAIIAGLAFGFSPYRASQMPHLQLLVTCWMAFGLLALHRYLRDRRPIDLVWLGACWLLNGGTNGYYLVFFAVLVGLWLLWFVRSWRDWIAIGCTLGLASLPMVPMLMGHIEVQGALGLARDRQEIESFSADLTAFLAASWHAWIPYHWTLEPKAEGELYPGLVIVVLTVVGAIVGWRRVPRPKVPYVSYIQWIMAVAGVAQLAVALVAISLGGLRLEVGDIVLLSVRMPLRTLTAALWCLIAAVVLDRRLADAWWRRSPFVFYTLAACVTAMLALGPVGRVFGETFMLYAPYAWLMELPGGDSLRVPARFAMLTMLCLAQTAALALARLTPQGIRASTLALLAVLIAADGWVPKMLVAPVQKSIALPGLGPGTAVLEVPIRDLWSETAALLRATTHGHPVVNGFSGYGPPHYDALAAGLAAGDRSVIASLRRLGPLAVLVNRSEDAEGTHEAFIRGADEAQLMYRTPIGPVYRFSALPVARRPADEIIVPIAGILPSRNAQDTSLMTDGDVATQWKSGVPQAPGDQMRVLLSEETVVSSVEMDLGDARMDFPRTLRVEARTDDGQVSTVWLSGMSGPAMVAAFVDWRTLPLRIDLPAGTRARELILTLTEGNDEFYWTVAEMRIFGHVSIAP